MSSTKKPLDVPRLLAQLDKAGHLTKMSRAEIVIYLRLVNAGEISRLHNSDLFEVQTTASRAISALETRELIKIRYDAANGKPVRVIEVL